MAISLAKDLLCLNVVSLIYVLFADLISMFCRIVIYIDERILAVSKLNKFYFAALSYTILRSVN